MSTGKCIWGTGLSAAVSHVAPSGGQDRQGGILCSSYNIFMFVTSNQIKGSVEPLGPLSMCHVDSCVK